MISFISGYECSPRGALCFLKEQLTSIVLVAKVKWEGRHHLRLSVAYVLLVFTVLQERRQWFASRGDRYLLEECGFEPKAEPVPSGVESRSSLFSKSMSCLWKSHSTQITVKNMFVHMCLTRMLCASVFFLCRRVPYAKHGCKLHACTNQVGYFLSLKFLHQMQTCFPIKKCVGNCNVWLMDS